MEAKHLFCVERFPFFGQVALLPEHSRGIAIMVKTNTTRDSATLELQGSK